MRTELASCDLLSISVLTNFGYNEPRLYTDNFTVVICFQFQFLLTLVTTGYKSYALQLGCDLLSISVLTNFGYNKSLYMLIQKLVVICFQFQFLLTLVTTCIPHE